MRMRNSGTAAGCALIMAALVLAPRTAAAQSNPFDRYDTPALVQNFTGGTVRSVEDEFRADLYVLDAFSGKKRVDRYDRGEPERAQPLKFYGRPADVFPHQLEPGRAASVQLPSSGSEPLGRIYIGIHRPSTRSGHGPAALRAAAAFLRYLRRKSGSQGRAARSSVIVVTLRARQRRIVAAHGGELGGGLAQPREQRRDRRLRQRAVRQHISSWSPSKLERKKSLCTCSLKSAGSARPGSTRRPGSRARGCGCSASAR